MYVLCIDPMPYWQFKNSKSEAQLHAHRLMSIHVVMTMSKPIFDYFL